MNEESVKKDFDPKMLPEGTVLTCTNYYKVMGHEDDEVSIIDSTGNALLISHDIVKNECVPATTAKGTEKVTRTRMAELIQGSQRRAFRVRFHTKPKDADVEGILNEQWAAADNQRKRRKLIREKVLAGEEKTMTCHLYKDEHLMGRAQVIDLDEKMKGTPNPFRQIDYRSIEELWIDNMHYVLK